MCVFSMSVAFSNQNTNRNVCFMLPTKGINFTFREDNPLENRTLKMVEGCRRVFGTSANPVCRKSVSKWGRISKCEDGIAAFWNCFRYSSKTNHFLRNKKDFELSSVDRRSDLGHLLGKSEKQWKTGDR